MYCTCSNKKKVVTTIASNRVEVCSKNLGGCGKEIGYTYSYAAKNVISLSRSLLGKKFLTRSGSTVELIQVTEGEPYPFIFETKDGNIVTTTSNGRYSLGESHKYDIVEML